ncbi:MAG TPA: hypothetical protein VL325_11355 [Pyrinomonadaceae bacterium]|jgi:hypothetical protein|nr:hypothetical protein [Pyrinomonadaceae bacterium]
MTFFLVVVIGLSGSCKIPNLESQQCGDAREAVRKFYSFHYSNDIAPTAENLEARKKYLTADLFRTLSEKLPPKDYFTDSDTAPKAFRVAACREVNADTTNLGVHLFWKPNDGTNIQKEVEVETVRQGDDWLINKVTPK